MSRPPLTARTALLALAATAPLAALGLAAYRFAASAFRESAAAADMDRARLEADLVQDMLDRRLRVVETDAADPDLTAPVAARDAAAVRRRLAAQRRSEGADRAFVVDPSGLLWADDPPAPESLKRNFAHRAWFQDAARADGPVVSPVYVRFAAPRVPVVATAAPVRHGGRRVGFLVHQYRLEPLDRRFAARAFGREGRLFVFDDLGQAVGAGSEGKSLAGIPPVRAALAGLSGRVDYRDPASRRLMTAAYAPVRAGARRWGVIARSPAAETEDVLRGLRLELGAATLAAVLCVGWAALTLAGARERERHLRAELEERRARLEEQTRVLARSNADLEQFAYLASHDLQAPLRSLKNYCDLFNERCGAALNDEGRRLVSLTRGSVERMQRMVQDLLEFSRLGREKEPLKPVSLEACLDEAMADLASELGRRRGTVERQPLPEVEGRAGQLTRLLQNLLSNAVKYCEAEPRVKVSAARDDGFWVVSVADNGIGVPAEKREAVFGLFERLHAWEKFPGSGIGLAACRKIVEHHGGRIWLESEPGRGTTVRFTLPVPPPCPAS